MKYTWPSEGTTPRDRLLYACTSAQRLSAYWHDESTQYSATAVRVFEQEQSALYAENARALLGHLQHTDMVSA